MQYLLLIHRQTTALPTATEWTTFIELAEASGLFRGGSEVGQRELIGQAVGVPSTAHIDGYMRFDSDDKQKLRDLLVQHPVVIHGGTIELCELPES